MADINRRHVVALIGAAGMAGSWSDAHAQNEQLTAAGFARDTADKLDMALKSGLLNGLHGAIVMRGGKTVIERYVKGEDWSWGNRLGIVNHGPGTLHDLRSVSKSVTSLLYGIALAEGKVAPPDAKLLTQFPALTDLASDPQRAAWTVQQALDMVLGTEWNEDLPYTDARNSEIAMEQASDRYRYILDRPIVSAPGTRWTYNGGCTALIGAMIAAGTKTTLEDYARDKLFGPLGITTFEWIKGSNGVAAPASGLRMTLPDLAKVGQLLLAKGQAQGRRIVPVDWVDAVMKPSVPVGDGRQYSRQWYVLQQPVPAAKGMRGFTSGVGNGGQRLFVSPSLDLVVAIFAGNYNAPDQWIVPTLILQKLILANIERA
jgi:CubicO group peptidase (beta-lactamase class C family)